MRIMIFIILVFIFISCGKESKVIDDFVAKNEKVLTKEVRSALDEAMQEEFQMARRMQEGMARSGEAAAFADLFMSEEKYKEMTFKQFPLYDLDMEKFVQNPCEEQVVACIRPSEEQLLFAGRRDGRLVMSVSIKKDNGKWRRGRLGIMRESDFVRNYAELPSLLAKVDNNQFFFLLYLNHLMFVYEVDGVRYFSTTCKGGGMTTANFAEMALEQYKLWQENVKWSEKLNK